ncbi:hypothetical protein KFZ76_19395 [Methylovulum psychrotolerans]|uniref:hypothetical protein n=1 Tax=Methylovulum psychrotolerans TaxID=1704499 RepID=UPI001BFF0CBF|nr:hypothetical protein [Methylovulum psychrotolerans]MBT9099866.1 hypothetical protein [Methylovulum psychrotolerans]
MPTSTNHDDNGNAVTCPAPVNRATALMTALDGFTDDFIQYLEEDHAQQPKLQDREAL